MLLENQKAPPKDAEKRLDEFIARPIPVTAYRRELNEAEQDNIVRTQAWALARHGDMLTERFVKERASLPP